MKRLLPLLLLATSLAQQPSQTEPIYQQGTSGVTPPKCLKCADPDYSEKARKKKITGTVFLKLVINARGKVESAEVTKPLEKSLDKAALEAVKRWTFTPALKDGNPVRFETTAEVNFSIYD
jgi:TonB family protein